MLCKGVPRQTRGVGILYFPRRVMTTLHLLSCCSLHVNRNGIKFSNGITPFQQETRFVRIYHLKLLQEGVRGSEDAGPSCGVNCVLAGYQICLSKTWVGRKGVIALKPSTVTYTRVVAGLFTCRVGSGRVGSGRVGSGRVGVRPDARKCRDILTRPNPTRPATFLTPADPTRGSGHAGETP